MAARYQVVAECAHVTMSTPSGRMVVLQLKGAMVPADAPELERLLDLGYVAKVGDDETGGVDASGIPAGAYAAEVPAAITSTPVAKSEEQRQADAEAADKANADAEVADRRAAAKAKLPEDGSAPDGRASKDVRVEWLAGQGHDYDELMKQDDAALKDLVKQRSPQS
jgi:hypothetical protein